MRCVLWGVLCLALSAAARAEGPDRPLAVLDTGGHTGRVTAALFTPDGKEVVSVSLDGTVRCWRTDTGHVSDRPRPVLRLPAAPPRFGAVHCAALAPDGRLLAVDGAPAAGDKPWPVYLLALDTGSLRQVLHTPAETCALAFSADGKRLAAGSTEGTVQVWKADTGQPELPELKGPGGRITGLAFSPDGNRLAAAGRDGVRLWKLAGGQAESDVDGTRGAAGLAWSPDGKLLAVPHGRGVRLWSVNDRTAGDFDLPGRAGACTFSADARRLLVGFQAPETAAEHEAGPVPGPVLLDVASGKELVRGPAPTSSSGGWAALSPDGQLAVSAGTEDPAELVLWKTAGGQTVATLAGPGRTVWSVAWNRDGSAIAWGTEGKLEDFETNGTRAVRYTFSLARLEPGRPLGDDEYRQARATAGNPPTQGQLPNEVWSKRGNRTVVALFGQRCGALLAGGERGAEPLAVTGGADLLLYQTRTGKLVRRFQGHRGAVFALASSADDRYLLSGSDDQTLRLWRPDQDQPILSLFCAGDDWVAWTPEGYYAGSPRGEQMLGWQVQEPNQLATFVPASWLQKSLYQPRRIRELLAAPGKGAGTPPADKVGELLPPPQVAIADINGNPPKPAMTLPAAVKVRAVVSPAPGGRKLTWRLLVNGKPTDNDGAPQQVGLGGGEASWETTLYPGVNRLSVEVETDAVKAVSAPVEVTRAAVPPGGGDKGADLPTLYVLTAGISAYPDLPPKQQGTAAPDAVKLAEALRKYGAPLFKEIKPAGKTIALTDKEATLNALRDSIKDLREKMQRLDVAVVFFAGWGEKDGAGQFYLEPYDCHPDRLETEGLANSDLLRDLGQTRGRVILLLDCYAPREADGRKSGGSQAREGLSDRDVQNDHGLVVLRASNGREEASESDERRRGYFARALVEGLSGKADANGDGGVDFDELAAYVSRRVDELSANHPQHPRLEKHSDFLPIVLSRPGIQAKNAGTEPPAAPAALGKDTAVLEVELPKDGSLAIDGADQGDKRRFEYPALAAGRHKLVRVTVGLAGGKREQRTVLLQGGWHVRLAVGGTAAARPELVVQAGHSGPVRAAAVSRDGRFVLTGSDDQTAILWDAATGQQLRGFHGQHQKSILAVAFSPDGKKVLTGSADRRAILWDAATGKPEQRFVGHTGPVYAVAFSPDGKQVLTGSDDQTARLWDSDSGQAQVTFEGQHTGRVLTVAVSPDGKQVLTGSFDTTALLWDAVSGRVLRHLRKHVKPVTAVAFSHDGRRLLTASEDQTALLWDAGTGEMTQLLATDNNRLTAAAFSPGSGRVVLGVADGTAVIWDVERRRQVRVLKGHGGAVTAVAFHPKEDRVLTASVDQTAAWWDVATGERRLTFQGRSAEVRAMALTPDGRHLLVGSGDGTASRWDLDGGVRRSALQQQQGAVLSVAVSADGERGLAGALGPRPLLWETGTGKGVRLLEEGKGKWVTAVALSGDGRQALVGSWDGSLALWDVAADKKLFALPAHKDLIAAAAFSPDGRWALTGSSDQTAVLWEVPGGDRVREFAGHTDGLRAVAFSPDGKYILTGGNDRKAILWEAATGKPVRTLARGTDRERAPEGSAVTAVAFSPDGSLALTGGADATDATVLLWDVATGDVLRQFRGHTEEVRAVCFGPDGRHILTGSRDGTTRLWDVATGDELGRLFSLDRGNEWLVITPEGLFDGSEKGREYVAYRRDGALDVVPVNRFFGSNYQAGLLAALWRGERPLPRAALDRRAPPVVRLSVDPPPDKSGVVDSSQVAVVVEAESKEDGVEGPELFVNDGLQTPPQTVRRGGMWQRRFRVVLHEGVNTLRARAACPGGGPESEPATLTLRYEKVVPSRLHVLAVGINQYAGKEWGVTPLRLAVADAKALAALFKERADTEGGRKLYRDGANVVSLLDGQATGVGIRQAFKDLADKARPQDTLVVFLAGHGTTVGTDYYFLPQDYRRRVEQSADAAIREQGLSHKELGELLLKVKASRRVLIFATCHAGGALQAVWTLTAQQDTVARLGHYAGVYALAAVPTGDEVQEPEPLGYSVLTYVLLAALKGAAAGPLAGKAAAPDGPEGTVTVGRWFNFAAEQAPPLTSKYHGVEQIPRQSTFGAPFPLLPLPEP